MPDGFGDGCGVVAESGGGIGAGGRDDDGRREEEGEEEERGVGRRAGSVMSPSVIRLSVPEFSVLIFEDASWTVMAAV